MNNVQRYVLESLTDGLISEDRLSRSTFLKVEREYKKIINNYFFINALMTNYEKVEVVQDMYNENYKNKFALLLKLTMQKEKHVTRDYICNLLQISDSRIENKLLSLSNDYPNIIKVSFNKDLQNVSILK